MKTVEYHFYRGYLDGSVYIDDDPLPLCLEIVNHSPDGFAWGYEGSGPAQLALAIMVNEYGPDLTKHPCHYQDIKRDIIAKLPQGAGFILSNLSIRDRAEYSLLDPVFSYVNELLRNGEFGMVDSSLRWCIVEGMSKDLMLGWLTSTLMAKGFLSERENFFERVQHELSRRDELEAGLLECLA